MTAVRDISPDPVWRQPAAIALLLAASLTTMANATISPALPGLAQVFGGDPPSERMVRLLVPAPSLSIVLAAPVLGVLVDRLGRTVVLRSGIALFVLAGMAGLVLPTLGQILASRLLLGVAVAMIMTAQTALVGDLFAGARRQSLVGLQIAARNFGGLVFIALASWLAGMAPRLPFAVYGLAALFLPVVWLSLREPARTMPGRADVRHATVAEGSLWRVALAALAALQVVTSLFFFVVPTELPFFLAARGFDPATTTGQALGSLMLAGGLAALAYARIRQRLGDAGAFAAGYLAMAAGFAAIGLSHGLWGILAGAVLTGIGYALVAPNFVALALRLAPASRTGSAAGLMTMSVFLGQIASPFVSQPLVGHQGYDRAFVAAGILLALMAAAAVLSHLLARVRAAGLPANWARSQ